MSPPVPVDHGTITGMTVPATATASEPTHACVRCGAPVVQGVGLCEDCNPLGLKDVSASQVHGTAFIGIVAAIVLLALVARLAVSGVGPFTPVLSGVAPDGGGLAVTLTITNHGSSAGRTTCRLTVPADRNGLPGGLLLSPEIEPGQTVTFTKRVTGLGTAVRDLAIECNAP